MTERLSSSEYLLEHCGCADGCPACNGTTRRLRHTHDPRSGIDGHDYEKNERTTTKGQVNRSGETVASEAPPTMQHGAEASGSDRVGERKRGGEGEPIGAIRAARAGTGDPVDDRPAPMPEAVSPETLRAAQYRAAEDPHEPEFYRVGQTGVEPMPVPVDDAAEARIEKLLAEGRAEFLTFSLADISAAIAHRERVIALARVLRDPTNNEPLKKLLDAIDEANRG